MRRESGRDNGFWLEPPGNPDAAEAVAVRLASHVSVADLPAAKLTRAMAGDPTEALAVARALLRGGNDDDGHSWLWVAASFGSGVAREMLARVLARESCAVFPCRQREYLSRLAVEWLASAPDQPITTHRSERSRQEAGGPAPKRHREQRHAGFAALRARSDTDDDNVVDGPGDIPASAAGIVVLERIGDCDSREGRDISARYAGIVGKRLSFRGALPAPGEAEADLARRWPWAPSAARFVEGRLALLRRAFMAGGEVGRLRLPPVLLVGPPGSGKTTFLEHLCALLRLPTTMIPCGGAADSAGLTAVSRGWSTARASAPLQAMAEHACPNPALILDELDKGTDIGGRNGSAVAAALGMLTGPTAFWDSCLLAPADVSHVTFLATANNLARLPSELLDRFSVLEFPRPAPEHFPLVLDAIRNAEADRLGVDRRFMPTLGSDDHEWLQAAFLASGRSVRALERAHATLIGEIAAEEETHLLRFPN